MTTITKEEVLEDLYDVMKKHGIAFVIPANMDRTIAVCLEEEEGKCVYEFSEEFSTFELGGLEDIFDADRIKDNKVL